MINQHIRIGTKLELEVINNLGQKQGNTYISQLIDIVDPDTIMIAAPIYGSRVIFIPTGAKLRIFFINENGDLMNFSGIITLKEKQGNMAYMLVSISGDMEKIQRRDYYRLPCCLDAGYRIYQEPPEVSETEEDTAPAPQPYVQTITRNISGGGICLVAEHGLDRGTLLDVQLDIGGQDIQVICKLVRCSRLETASGGKYELGLTYYRISKRDQDFIVRYIFEQQKMLLKKNLGAR